MKTDAEKRAMGDRLKIARGLNKLTPTQACARFGWKYPTYMNHEGGERDWSSTAGTYADAYRVNLGWLLSGKGRPRGPESRDPLHDAIDTLDDNQRVFLAQLVAVLAAQNKGNNS